VVEVEEVAALDRLIVGKGSGALGVTDSSSSVVGIGECCFFCPPKEKVRPAAFKKPVDDDLGMGGTGISPYFLCEFRHSSCPLVSAEDGAVDELL